MGHLNSFLQAKDTEIRGTKFVVDALKAGVLYQFRVKAVNVAGAGEPGFVSELIETKDRTSKTQMNPKKLSNSSNSRD